MSELRFWQFVTDARLCKAVQQDCCRGIAPAGLLQGRSAPLGGTAGTCRRQATAFAALPHPWRPWGLFRQGTGPLNQSGGVPPALPGAFRRDLDLPAQERHCRWRMRTRSSVSDWARSPLHGVARRAASQAHAHRPRHSVCSGLSPVPPRRRTAPPPSLPQLALSAPARLQQSDHTAAGAGSPPQRLSGPSRPSRRRAAATGAWARAHALQAGRPGLPARPVQAAPAEAAPSGAVGHAAAQEEQAAVPVRPGPRHLLARRPAHSRADRRPAPHPQ